MSEATAHQHALQCSVSVTTAPGGNYRFLEEVERGERQKGMNKLVAQSGSVKRGREPRGGPAVMRWSSRSKTSEDSALIDAALTGDRMAFTALVQRYDDRMRGLAWQLLGNQSDMDDVLQDAYLKAYRSLGSFRRDAAFSSWLYRIVQTTCIDAYRRRARRPQVSLEVVADPRDPVNDPATAVTDRDALRHALAALPEQQLAAVLLVDAEGFSYAEASELLDVAAGTIASRVNRARTTLRQTLSKGDAQ